MLNRSTKAGNQKEKIIRVVTTIRVIGAIAFNL
jgi:hypothetical protein